MHDVFRYSSWIQIILNLYGETSTNLNFNTQLKRESERESESSVHTNN